MLTRSKVLFTHFLLFMISGLLLLTTSCEGRGSDDSTTNGDAITYEYVENDMTIDLSESFYFEVKLGQNIEQEMLHIDFLVIAKDVKEEYSNLRARIVLSQLLIDELIVYTRTTCGTFEEDLASPGPITIGGETGFPGFNHTCTTGLLNGELSDEFWDKVKSDLVFEIEWDGGYEIYDIPKEKVKVYEVDWY